VKRQLEPLPDLSQSALGVAESPYLLTDEAARFLRFKDARLFREWAKRNRVPVLHRGRTLLYRRSVLESFLHLKPSRHARTVTKLRAVENDKRVADNSLAGNGVAR
jgi:hypothetical protein